MRTNALQQVVISEDDMVDVLYRGQQISCVVVDNPAWIQRYNRHCANYDLSYVNDWTEESNATVEQFIQENVSDWHLPDDYKDFDLDPNIFHIPIDHNLGI